MRVTVSILCASVSLSSKAICDQIVPDGLRLHDFPRAPSHTHMGAWAESDVEKWWTELFLPGFSLHDVPEARL